MSSTNSRQVAQPQIRVPEQVGQSASRAIKIPNAPWDYARAVNGQPEFWFEYKTSHPDLMQANTFGSDYDTIVWVYRSHGGTLSLIDMSDDANTAGGVVLQSQAGFLPVKGATYLIKVMEKGNYQGGPVPDGIHLRFRFGYMP